MCKLFPFLINNTNCYIFEIWINYYIKIEILLNIVTYNANDQEIPDITTISHLMNNNQSNGNQEYRVLRSMIFGTNSIIITQNCSN